MIVREIIEETINALIAANAGRLHDATSKARGKTQKSARTGITNRTLSSDVGPISLKIPKQQRAAFALTVIDGFERNQRLIEQALVEMYVTRISKSRIGDIATALLGSLATRDELKNCGYRIHANLDGRRKALIDCRYHALAVEPVEIESPWGEAGAEMKLLVASALNVGGTREVLAVRALNGSRATDIRRLLQHLAIRGLRDSRKLH